MYEAGDVPRVPCFKLYQMSPDEFPPNLGNKQVLSFEFYRRKHARYELYLQKKARMIQAL